VPESVGTWWARRQWSKGTAMPYPIGTYRSDWERYPVLIRQYHPEFNSEITLTQIPPAAEVYLVWECDVGHRFVATPEEQRSRPGGERRRSSWCPECARLAVHQPMRTPRVDVPDAGLYPSCGHPRDPRRVEAPDEPRCPLCCRLDSSPVTREQLLELVLPSQRAELAIATSAGRRFRWMCARRHPAWEASVERMLGGRQCRVCTNAAAAADRFAVGEAFRSPWAPKPASAAEAELRQRIGEFYDVDLSLNAVKVARAFFNHEEVWPDFALAEFRVAIEYDTIGRHGLEHVGRREEVDRRKDRLLRAAGWEIVRLRMGKLQPLGPYDVVGVGPSKLVAALDERLSDIRGELFVAAYRR